ncbi:ethanolamine ammonia-lyase subunit EutC [Asaia siamensis]
MSDLPETTSTTSDPWQKLRDLTRARIGLARTGNAQTTRDVLSFQAAHAMARDAVHMAFDLDGLRHDLAPAAPLIVSSAAPDRTTYLSRPDLGRRLAAASKELLPKGDWDLVFVLADGLSAQAVMQQGPAVFHACRRALPAWRIAPPVIAQQGRVAIGDDVAEALGARMVAVLIGERPGLSVPNSMGVYLTYNPAPGCPDSRRNCLSNIHLHGLGIDEACVKLVWLMREAQTLKLTGVGLKERAPQLSAPGTPDASHQTIAPAPEKKDTP